MILFCCEKLYPLGSFHMGLILELIASIVQPLSLLRADTSAPASALTTVSSGHIREDRGRWQLGFLPTDHSKHLRNYDFQRNLLKIITWANDLKQDNWLNFVFPRVLLKVDGAGHMTNMVYSPVSFKWCCLVKQHTNNPIPDSLVISCCGAISWGRSLAGFQ